MPLVSYSDSEDSDNDSTLKSDLVEPSHDIADKFSKTPLILHRGQSAKTNTVSHETTFIYLRIEPTVENVKQLEEALDKIGNIYPSLRTNLNEHSLINSLTRTPNDLHLTLCYNLTLTPEKLNLLSESLQNDDILTSIELPALLSFSKIMILERRYVAIIADSNTTLSKLASSISSHNIPVPSLLHATIFTLPDNPSLEKDGNPIILAEPLTLRATRLCMTRGREIVNIV